MFAERVKEQEKQMNLEKYQIAESYFRRTLSSRLLEIGLIAYLFCTSCFGTAVGALWALGYLEMWLA